MVVSTIVAGLTISHLVAILTGWWAKAKLFASTEAAKVKPEAEKVLAEVKAEVTKLETAAETDAKKVIAAIKAKL
jgi:multidrug resistance efflux pump